MRQDHDLTSMETFAARRLIEDGRPTGEVAHDLAAAFADRPALAVGFTLTSVASGLEVSVGRNGEDGFPDPTAIYRVVSVLSADVLGLELAKRRVIIGADLVRHWDYTNDPYFKVQP